MQILAPTELALRSLVMFQAAQYNREKEGAKVKEKRREEKAKTIKSIPNTLQSLDGRVRNMDSKLKRPEEHSVGPSGPRDNSQTCEDDIRDEF